MEPQELVLLEGAPVDRSAFQEAAPGSLQYVLERLSNSSQFLNRENPPSDVRSHAGKDSGWGARAELAWKRVGVEEGGERPLFPDKPVLRRVGTGVVEDPVT